jgi:hypothetical protein
MISIVFVLSLVLALIIYISPNGTVNNSEESAPQLNGDIVVDDPVLYQYGSDGFGYYHDESFCDMKESTIHSALIQT